jgi:hypothetical protein
MGLFSKLKPSYHQTLNIFFKKRSNSILYVYVYGDYLDNDGVNESTLHADEDENEARCHPRGNRVYVDGAHHDNVNDYGIKIREYEYDHDSQ